MQRLCIFYLPHVLNGKKNYGFELQKKTRTKKKKLRTKKELKTEHEREDILMGKFPARANQTLHFITRGIGRNFNNSFLLSLIYGRFSTFHKVN